MLHRYLATENLDGHDFLILGSHVDGGCSILLDHKVSASVLFWCGGFPNRLCVPNVVSVICHIQCTYILHEHM